MSSNATHLQVPHLPCTCRHQHDDLGKTVPHCSRIRGLAQISVIRFPLALVLLFSPNILQPVIEVADLGRDVGDVMPVLLHVGLGGADDDVQVHSDVRMAEPGGVIGAEADGVVACVVRGKCEAAFQRSDGLDDDMGRRFLL